MSQPAFHSVPHALVTLSIAVFTCLVSVTPLAGQEIEPSGLRALEYRTIGPDGNRTIAIVGEPGNPAVTYIGAASGGLWKTDDWGATWHPIFDDQDISSVSALAIAPTAHNVVWAGTGETFLIRPGHAMGDGVYKSTDAGKSWRHMGLEKTGRIARIVVDPRNADVVFACALGHAFGPQPDRGIYRTTDGGKTWDLVLHVDDDTGCSDIAIDPNSPDVLFAGMWSLHITTWNLRSGGPGGGVFVSRDGGSNWSRLGKKNGLPGGSDHIVGKVAVAVAPSNSQRVYALIEDTQPGLYRSNDGGKSFKLINQRHILAERSSYYTRFAVSPDDEDRLYFASVSWSVSNDGGETLLRNVTAAGHDNHDIWIDPMNADRILVAYDQGASISLNRGRTYQHVVLPIAQMYHVAVDNEIPYNVYGNRQDGYSYRGPSNSRAGSIPLGSWTGVGGCESGFAIPDTVDHRSVWSGCYDGQFERFDISTGHATSVQIWPDASYGWAPAEVKERWHWSFPIAISPHDHNRVYAGSQRVHMTTDGGNSWTVISPDLTTNDKSHQQSSGILTVDNLMTFDGALLFAIAESPLQDGLIWTGSNDGQVNITRDGGKTWTNVTKNIKDLPPWGTVANIEPSRYDAGSAYITVDLHQMGDFDPYVYKTSNYGKSWTRTSGDIPHSVSSFVHIVREDPVRQGMLYLGTDNSVYFSLNDGKHWIPLRNNMPPAPVYWLVIQEHFNDLVVATYGRGFWILDDVTPLRQLDAQVLASDLYVFSPRDAYRFRSVSGPRSVPGSFVTGTNPAYGADINYFLREKAKDTVRVSILSANNDTVRVLTGTNHAGINRVTWDLRYTKPREPKLRTSLPNKPPVELGKEGWRPLITWNTLQRPPLAPPGTYTVVVKAGDSQQSQTVTVLKDPHSTGSLDDIAAQVALSRKLDGMRNDLVEMIDQSEWLRKQLYDLTDMLASRKDAKDVIDSSKALDKQIIGFESNLFDVNLTGPFEDSFRSPMKLFGKVMNLANNVSGKTDFAPTTQQVAVAEQFQQMLQEYKAQFRALMDGDVAAFKRMLREKDLPSFISAMP
ncbi:MAG: WD40/YVTN/BNR-like repeat-containing protein [Gemmatimonadales bacterium]